MPANPHTLCPDCQEGRHDPLFHSELGCLVTVDRPPFDYVCECKLPVKRFSEKAIEQWNHGHRKVTTSHME